MVLLELYAPTFPDIKMPADGYCLYHCFNYVGSDGQATLTEDYAIKLQKRIVARIRRDGLSVQGDRLLQLGSAGYPDEPDFAYFAA